MSLSNLITILSVNYNSTSLTKRMIDSIRKYYKDIQILIVDGSDKPLYQKEINDCCQEYENITLHTLGYNIHHGPGMHYGLTHITTPYVLIIDADAYITKNGVLELLLEHITSDLLFIGCSMKVNKSGKNTPNGFDYIHPSFMFVNRSLYFSLIDNHVIRPFIKHGAPCITTMYDISVLENGNKLILDLNEPLKDYFIHDWNGVVKISGGYHLSKQHYRPSDEITVCIGENYIDDQKKHDDEIKLDEKNKELLLKKKSKKNKLTQKEQIKLNR